MTIVVVYNAITLANTISQIFGSSVAVVVGIVFPRSQIFMQISKSSISNSRGKKGRPDKLQAIVEKKTLEPKSQRKKQGKKLIVHHS